ncbi:MAG: AAA family ATPase [Alphaproteobacteria bacterium]
MPENIARWLEELGLGEYAEAFAANNVDSRILPELTGDDLKDIGVASVGHRRLLLGAIAELGGLDRAEPAPIDPPRAVEAERRQLTVMFCDLVGSTALSQTLDPEDLRDVMRRYQDAVAGAVTRYGGHVAKYLGDGVLAYFGWPRAYEDQAERAVRAALAAVEAVNDVKITDDKALAARAGIATGQVVVGDLVGESGREADAVTGETPNLAARLQGLAVPGAVVIGATTRQLVGNVFDVSDIGAQDLKGFDAAVPAWRVIGESSADSRFEAAHGDTVTQFVGRDHELGLLEERWSRARNGEGQIVLLSGEAGIGKSRMVRALREGIGQGGHFHLRYQCSPHHVNSALYPIIRRMRRAAGFAAEDTNDLKLDKMEAILRFSETDVEAKAPLFAALLSLPGERRYGALELQPQQFRSQVNEALIKQVLALARRRPVLFIFEDAHWIDPTTEVLISDLLARLSGSSILVVITHRPEYSPPWMEHPRLTALALSRLGRDQGLALISAAGGMALPEAVREAIADRAEGVPLFAEELTRAVIDEGGASVDRAGIPETLRALLMARLDRLGEAKELAQVGAAIGREFPHELVAAVAQWNEGKLTAALDGIVASGLVIRRGSGGEAVYTFKHALVQDEAYSSLLRARRRQLHHRIAEILEERFPDRAKFEPELLAHHYTEGGDGERAVTYWSLAGQHAIERSANLEAAAHLGRGIELLDALPPSQVRWRREIELQSSLGVAFISTKGFTAPEVARTYERCKELCQLVGDKAGLFTANWGLWLGKQNSIQFADADALSGELLDLAEGQNDPGSSLQAHHAAWTTCFSSGDLLQTLQHAEAGNGLYDIEAHRSQAFHFGGHDAGVCGLNFAAWSAWLLGYPERAQVEIQKALALAETFDHPFSSGTAHTYAATIFRYSGEILLVRSWARSAIEIARIHGFMGTLWTAMSAGHEAWVFGQEGDEDAALDGARAVLERKGPLLFRPSHLANLGEICLLFGHLDEGLSRLDEGLELVQQTGERWWESELFRLKGATLSAQGGDVRQIEAIYRQALEIAGAQSARSLELRAATSFARFLSERDRAGEAVDLLAPVHGWFTEGFDTPDLKDAKALLDSLA